MVDDLLKEMAEAIQYLLKKEIERQDEDEDIAYWQLLETQEKAANLQNAINEYFH